MLKKLLGLSGSIAERKAKLYRDLIHHEGRIGGELFGAVPKGCRREFFCLDEYTWVWHEEWSDKSGKRQARTTRYDIRPSGIVKSQNGQHYQRLSQSEISRFNDAVTAYEQRVWNELYKPVLQ